MSFLLPLAVVETAMFPFTAHGFFGSKIAPEIWP